MDTRGQSNVGVNPSTGDVNWAVIDFGEAVTFDNLDLYYETYYECVLNGLRRVDVYILETPKD